MEKITGLYNKKTTDNYYQAVGKDAEKNEKNSAEETLDSLIPNSLQDKTVLDLGCGNCRHSEIFCERGAKKVVAIDLSESMLLHAKIRKEEKRLSQLELVQTDMENLPFAKNEFDYIFSHFSLIHSGKMDEVINNTAKLLTPSGEFLIATNVAKLLDEKHRIDLSKPIPLILSKKDSDVKVEDFAYTMENYLSAFEKAGLEVISAQTFPYEKELSIDPNFPNRDDIEFSYGIFQVRKEEV